MHLSMLSPMEEGSGKGWGFDIFYVKNCQMPLPREIIPGQIPHPRVKIVFPKHFLCKNDKRTPSTY